MSGRCSIDGCCNQGRMKRGQRLCAKHYWRLSHHGDPMRGARKPAVTSCSVDGCKRGGRIIRGFCGSHYWRWKEHGAPLAGRTPEGTLKKWVCEVALAAPPGDCVIWPFKARYHDGYGQIRWDGKGQRVNRVVCQLAHGHPPDVTSEAAHNCGVRLCANPHHLRWATRKENMADCKLHGTVNFGRRNGSVKLTETEVHQIRGAPGTQAVIASQFGVSRSLIGCIKRRDIWGWL